MKIPDVLHMATNWISYNRGLAVTGLLAAIVLGLAGCQFTEKDPVSGAAEPLPVLETKRDEIVSKAEREASAELAKALAEVNRLREQASKDRAAAEAKIAALLAENTAESKVKAAVETAALASSQNEKAAEAERIAAAAEAFAAERRAQAAVLDAKYQSAIDKVQAKTEAAQAAVKTVADVTATVAPAGGPVGVALQGLLALVVGGLFVDNRRKDKKIKQAINGSGDQGSK